MHCAGCLNTWYVVYLCSSCDHVGDEVSVSWCIHQGHHLRVGLKLGHAHIHCHPSGANTKKWGDYLIGICPLWKKTNWNVYDNLCWSQSENIVNTLWLVCCMYSVEFKAEFQFKSNVFQWARLSVCFKYYALTSEVTDKWIWIPTFCFWHISLPFQSANNNRDGKLFSCV